MKKVLTVLGIILALFFSASIMSACNSSNEYSVIISQGEGYEVVQSSDLVVLSGGTAWFQLRVLNGYNCDNLKIFANDNELSTTSTKVVSQGIDYWYEIIDIKSDVFVRIEGILKIEQPPIDEDEEPSGETPTDEEEEPTGETPTDEDEEPSGETPTDEEEEPTGETPTDEDEEPAGETPTEEEEEPTGETPAEEEEEPTGETPAEEDEEPTGETPIDEDEDNENPTVYSKLNLSFYSNDVFYVETKDSQLVESGFEFEDEISIKLRNTETSEVYAISTIQNYLLIQIEIDGIFYDLGGSNFYIEQDTLLNIKCVVGQQITLHISIKSLPEDSDFIFVYEFIDDDEHIVVDKTGIQIFNGEKFNSYLEFSVATLNNDVILDVNTLFENFNLWVEVDGDRYEISSDYFYKLDETTLVVGRTNSTIKLFIQKIDNTEIDDTDDDDNDGDDDDDDDDSDDDDDDGDDDDSDDSDDDDDDGDDDDGDDDDSDDSDDDDDDDSDDEDFEQYKIQPQTIVSIQNDIEIFEIDHELIKDGETYINNISFKIRFSGQIDAMLISDYNLIGNIYVIIDGSQYELDSEYFEVLEDGVTLVVYNVFESLEVYFVELEIEEPQPSEDIPYRVTIINQRNEGLYLGDESGKEYSSYVENKGDFRFSIYMKEDNILVSIADIIANNLDKDLIVQFGEEAPISFKDNSDLFTSDGEYVFVVSGSNGDVKITFIRSNQ